MKIVKIEFAILPVVSNPLLAELSFEFKEPCVSKVRLVEFNVVVLIINVDTVLEVVLGGLVPVSTDEVINVVSGLSLFVVE